MYYIQPSQQINKQKGIKELNLQVWNNRWGRGCISSYTRGLQVSPHESAQFRPYLQTSLHACKVLYKTTQISYKPTQISCTSVRIRCMQIFFTWRLRRESSFLGVCLRELGFFLFYTHAKSSTGQYRFHTYYKLVFYFLHACKFFYPSLVPNHHLFLPSFTIPK